MIVMTGMLVAVTDGETLRLFRNKGREPRIDLVELREPALHPANTGSGGRHRSSTANPDDSRLREDDFAAAVAEYLNSEALTEAFEHVVVVADPRTLGALRKRVEPSLKAKLAGELGKDLVKHSVEAIENTLAAA